MLVRVVLYSPHNKIVIKDLATLKKRYVTVDEAKYQYPTWGDSGEYWYYLKCTSGCQLIKHHIVTGEQTTLPHIPENVINYSVASSEQFVVVNFRHENNAAIGILDVSTSAWNVF